MITTRRAASALALALAAAAAAVLVFAAPAAADTIAVETPPVVLAQDTTPAPATIPADVVGIDANIVGGLTITGHQGKRVSATAKGRATRSVTTSANTPAVIKGLVPGVRYTITIGGRRIATAIPLAQVGASSGLRVETTTTTGTVQLSWTHIAAPHEGTDVTYDITATPLTGDGTDGPDVITTTGTGTTATLTGLDSTSRYRFSVTPRNTASTGRATIATMTTTLADFTGAPPTAPEPTPPTPQPTTTAPAPAPAPAPATKTIYVCPAGFPENSSGVCEKTAPYTFTTTAYTYHPVNVYGYGQVDWAYSWGHCTGTGKSGNWSNGDPYCQTPVYGDNAVIGTQNVKDATPAGATDTGSAWTTKDPAPAGYADNGTAWVMHAAKVATVVPA